MAINWAERLDNIKNNVKTDMENTSTNRWAAILDQGRANQKFQGLQIKLSDFENSKSGFEKSANSFISGWQNESSTNNFYNSFGSFYAEAETIRQDLEENASAYKSILGDEKYKTLYDSFDAVSKNKDSDLEQFKRKGDLYSKYKTADEYNKAYRTSQIGSKYDNIKTFEDYNKYIKSGNFEQADMPKDEKEYLLRLGYALEYQETLGNLNAMKKRLEGLPDKITVNDPYNTQQRVNIQTERKQLESGIKKAEARIKEMDNMGGVYTGLNTEILSGASEYGFDQRWANQKAKMEEQYEDTSEKDRIRKMAGLPTTEEEKRRAALTDKEKIKLMSGQKVDNSDYWVDEIFKKAEPYQHLYYATDDEKRMYSFIKERDGEGLAQKYLEDLKISKLDKRLNQAIFQKMSDYSAQNGGTAILGSLASIPASVFSGLEFAAYRLGGEKFDGIRSTLATRSQGFREGTKTHWDGAWGEKVWDFLYDTGMSGVDSAAAAGLSAAVPFLGEALLGSSAAASTYNDALDRGISHGDAMLTALTAGVAESLFEHMSISKFLDAGDITKGFTKSGLRQATKTLLTEMGINFSEELFTEVSNIITDTAINGNLSNYAIAVKDYYMQGMSPEEAKNKALADFGKQILEAGASGALMGFGFGNLSSIKGMARSQVLNSQKGGLVKLSGNVAELKTVAELSNNKEIKSAAEKLTETSKPSEIGYVYNSLVADAVEQSVKEMTPVLLENGAKESGSNSAKGWATQIANSLFDKNEGKKAELSINKVTSEVYSDFITEGKYGGDKLLNLKNIISTPYLNQKTTASEVGTVLNENGIEAPVAADGSGAAIGPVAEAYKQGVAENLEKQRPNPKAMSEEELMKTYFADEVQISPEEEKVLKDFGKANGLEVDFVDGAVNGKGYGVFQNGKQIVISRYAKKPMRALFKHEFGHSVEKAKGYAKFQKYLFEESEAFKQWVELRGYNSWSEFVNNMVAKYKEQDVKYENPYIKAKADIVADFVGDYLFGEVVDKDGNPIKIDTNFLAELKQKDRNLFNRFVEWMHSILQRLKASGVVDKDIIKLEQKFKRLAEQARQQRAKGESETGKTDGQYLLADEINKSAQKVAVEYDAETESVAPQYSLASWEDSSYVKDRNNAAQKIADAIGVSKRTAIKYIDSINSIAKVIADDRVRLDYDPATGKTSFVSNVEYGGSIDFSTLCQKRKWLTGTFSAIQRELKNSALTASEVLKIRNMLKEKGIEVSCGLCYVEGSRAEMGIFAKQFIERYKKRNPEYVPDMADVNTPEGVEALRMEHPEVYKAYEEFWNNKGVLNEGDSVLFASQRKPKLYSVRTDYKHEILDKFKNEDNVNEKNKNGGLRIQSFSDFEIVHLIDMMQVIMDMSQVGLAGQAYTKVSDFALSLGDTGLKINLSLIAKGVDADGNLIFDDVEGMPIDTAMHIRNMYSKNVGTVLVVFNDAQLKAALNDKRVDFIIPFHRSQWKKSQYAELGLPKDTKDYTYMQNERYIKPVYYTTRKGTQGKRKATNYMPIKDYWDFNKSGKENAESYLKLCAENNKRPKFYKLLVDNKDGSYSLQPDGSTDGYWKLLIDFKMYDNNGKGSPQMPVKPIFNMQESMRMLDEYKGDHTSFPADQETVDAFVKEYKAKHKLDTFTESKSSKVEVKDDYDIGSFSLPEIDSTGQKLSAGQMQYFKDSKVRDGKGRLIPVYHGSKSAGFTEFTKSDEIGYFFARTIKTSRTYAGGSKAIYAPDKNSPEFSGAANYKVYLDIKKPYIIDGNGANWNQLEANGERVDISIKSQKWNNGNGIAKIQFKYNGKTYSQTVRTSEEFESFISKHTNPEMAKAFAYAMGQAVDKNGKGEFNAGFIWDFKNSVQGDTKNTRDIVRKAYNSHWNYDGVIFKNVVDSGDGSKIKADDLYVVFDSNQIKSVNNTNPTEDKDIRYSLPDIPDIARGKSNAELDEAYEMTGKKEAKENSIAELKRDVKRLRTLLDLARTETHGREFDPAKIEKAAKRLLKRADSTYAVDSLAEELGDLYRYIAKGEDVSFEEITEKANAIAKKLYDNMRPQKPDTGSYLYGLKKFIQSNAFSLTDKQKEEVAAVYGSFGNFIKQNMGRLKYRADAIPLNVLWSGEWNELYPGVFDKGENEGDMALALAELYDNTVKGIEYELQVNEDEFVKYFSAVIYDEFWNVPNIATVADRYSRQLSVLKSTQAERMAALREQRDRKVENTKKYYRDMINRIHETHDSSAIVKKIRKQLSKFATLLVNPNQNKHIPSNLVKPIKALCDAFNYSIKGEQRIYEKLSRVEDAYANLETDNNNELDVFDENVLAKLKEAKALIGENKLSEISHNKLVKLYDILRMFARNVTEGNRLFKEGRSQTVAEKANRAMEIMKKKGFANVGAVKSFLQTAGFSNMKPEIFFRTLGNEVLLDLYYNLRDSEDVWALDMLEARRKFESVRKKYKKDIKDDGKTKTFETKDGKVELTLEQRMFLYAAAKRPQYQQHIFEGGFVFDKDVKIKKQGGKTKVEAPKTPF